MRTRSSAPSSEQSKPDQSSKLPLTTEKPSKSFILPSSASDEARFLQLPNPQTGELTRYYFCPKLGIYEFTVVASSAQAPRSILFTPRSEISTAPDGKRPTPGNATVAKTAQLLIATPIDVVFFLLPLLCPTSSQAKGLFQPLDDIIDSQDDLPKHLRHVLYDESFKSVLQARAEAICDSVEAGDEKMLRFSEAKLVQELLAKAERMVAQGLPASMEERFIRQALATPLMAVKREDSSTNATSSNSNSEGEAGSQEDKETPATAASSTSVPTPSDVSTPATESPLNDPAASDDVARLLRISTALTYMKDSYLPGALRTKIDGLLSSPDSPVDFKPMHDHLKRVAELRAEALASRSSGDFSRKRDADDEDAETRAEKKRRKEEEEKKKKAGESRGVRDLKKVNTTGMKKMSDFFSKAAPKKKS
ncbi:ribonuclease H2, subunit B [Aspergillus bertholletiae]|uniref:Ribonuclease H2 subunit B n=1 Tax=Aspergillus bertholletiae TaxID=1226010 RepID=A0A5N7AVP7_9EURO|nr:ribonuclease H2, subunit B [Aspergillus bertholletiae]